jgi:post-segregation antitoxin (ccd killing protein)
MASRVKAEKSNRRSVNLTIPEDVIKTAKALKLNASEAAEAGIRHAIAVKQAEQWLSQNQPALAAHNNRIETSGTLLTPAWADDE